MRWRAAFVPLAAVTAATFLFSTAAWGQATEEPSPDPVAVETPSPDPTGPETAPTPDPVEVDVEEPAESKQVAEEPKPSRGDKDRASEGQGAPLPALLTFYATPKVVSIGKNVRVWGEASSPTGGDWVKIVNAETGRKIRTIKIKTDDTYEGFVRVRKNVPLQARYEALRSKWRHIGAVPDLKVGMSDARLFGRVKVSGRTNRVAAGKWVKLTLLKDGNVKDRRSVKVDDRGRFKTKFGIDGIGTHRATAVLDSKDWRKADAKSGRSTTPLPRLSEGSSGVFVKLLERRLAELRHHLAGRNSYFGQDTADAVMAFNKVNRRARVSYVTSGTWRALANERAPKARFKKPGFHIEVDQSKQVLYVVRKGKVRSILHAATGKPSTPTYDGTYQFWGKLAGYSPKRLYYPSFFHGARGIHGWPDVPPYKASHGCVRIPMWAAKWIFAKIEVGDTIRIYH